jgi:uncharacterized protein (TIGR02145 family)
MHKLHSYLLIAFLFIAFFACTPERSDTFTDDRDGQVYEFVQIGDQVWMKENLRFKPESGIYWAYDDKEARGDTFGLLYDWDRAFEVCPEGWHLPGKSEWEALIAHLGGEEVAGAALKDVTSQRWKGGSESNTNSRGFSALPEGVRRYDGRYSYFNKYAYFWTSDTGRTAEEGWCFAIDGPQKRIHRVSWDKNNALSIRCVKDK